MCATENEQASDADLIRSLQNGDISAFDALFERHRRGLLAYTVGICRNRSLAEDMVQECFVKLVKNIGSIKPTKGVTPWLYRTARNATIDVMRKRNREHLEGNEEILDRQDTYRDSAGPDPACSMIAEEEAASIRTGLTSLSEDDRELISLRYYGNIKFREMTSILERPLGTVLWQTQRALQRLKKVMEAAND